MYTNSDYQNLLNVQKRSGSKDLEDMLTQIGKFYKEINEKFFLKN